MAPLWLQGHGYFAQSEVPVQIELFSLPKMPIALAISEFSKASAILSLGIYQTEDRKRPTGVLTLLLLRIYPKITFSFVVR